MSIKNYVPILRPKQGEVWAIRDLSEVARERITPFFDVHRVQIVNGKLEKTFDEHMESIIRRICKNWPSNRKFFWDMYSIDPSTRTQDGTHPVLRFGEILFSNKMTFIPTIGTDRDESYIEAIKELLSKGTADEICVRILDDDLETPIEAIGNFIQILKKLKVPLSRGHLLIDIKTVKESNIEVIVDTVSEFTSECEISDWKTFTFSSGSFPVDMSGFAPDSVSRVPRVEVKLWKALLNAELLIGRKPNFSDYAILNPERVEIDPTRIRAGGKIRYATEDDWIIAKGYGLHRGEKYNQYRKLSRKIIGIPEYRGKGYSWGDDYLDKCSKGKVGTGGLPMWVRVDTNHHLTLVGEQISTLYDSSGKG